MDYGLAIYCMRLPSISRADKYIKVRCAFNLHQKLQALNMMLFLDYGAKVALHIIQICIFLHSYIPLQKIGTNKEPDIRIKVLAQKCTYV